MVQVWYQDTEWPSVWKVFRTATGQDTFTRSVAWDWVEQYKAWWNCYKVVDSNYAPLYES